ncbi:exodeoxyribonuclease VII small subunit [Cellulosimicrobium arenosum]|uniref:Exodeoxyribonuclease 7 small subunit n=1 Tax=Cellulosimicrobium arenosum TaxID=2708133 RepID=A0A927G7Z9_9MICO|nr:exodeoxyribonuclease VII small subunit [Cellulosimicrobium arenosum]MBD8078147.1 exodeoxyribonuclease VII small subunit [Cellulosimicrobium arenosum]
MGFTTAVTDDDIAVNTDDATTGGVADLTYEQARDELVQVVSRLEAGGEPLEASLALWERGEALARRCQEWLDGARARLDAARGQDPAQASAAGHAAQATIDDDISGGLR